MAQISRVLIKIFYSFQLNKRVAFNKHFLLLIHWQMNINELN